VGFCQLLAQGWKVVSDAEITPGTFVCEYAGELLRNHEAAKRLKDYDTMGTSKPGHALLVWPHSLPPSSRLSASSNLR